MSFHAQKCVISLTLFALVIAAVSQPPPPAQRAAPLTPAPSTANAAAPILDAVEAPLLGPAVNAPRNLAFTENFWQHVYPLRSYLNGTTLPPRTLTNNVTIRQGFDHASAAYEAAMPVARLCPTQIVGSMADMSGRT